MDQNGNISPVLWIVTLAAFAMVCYFTFVVKGGGAFTNHGGGGGRSAMSQERSTGGLNTRPPQCRSFPCPNQGGGGGGRQSGRDDYDQGDEGQE